MYYTLMSILFTWIVRFFKRKIYLSKGVLIDASTKLWTVGHGDRIECAANVHLRSRRYKYHIGMGFPTTLYTDGAGKIVIGENSRLNGTYVHASKKVVIGRNCVFAAGTQILDSNGHVVNSMNRTKGKDAPSDIIIGDNVWTGANTIILKGSFIGDNCVIGAGSVVKGSYPANAIIKGNPAIVVDEIKL